MKSSICSYRYRKLLVRRVFRLWRRCIKSWSNKPEIMELISSRASFMICVIVLSCFAQSDKPVNTLTEQSKRTNLTCCSASGSIAWKHQKLNNAGVPDQICLDRSCYRTGYSVDNSTPGCFHLIIDSTANDAAGLYQCNEVETGNVRGAYVVVYNFTCSVDFGKSDDLVEGDIVKFHCSVSWKGKWPFEIRLIKEDREEDKRVVISDVNSYYNSSFKVNVSKPNFPSYTIQFAFLNNGITDPNVDKSCPSVNWTSPARNVKYGPSIIKHSCPDQNCERSINDTISCSADGNPIPELHWLNWNDTKIASGSVLVLKCLGSRKYKCVATNIIRGKSHETSMGITVNVNSKPGVDGSRCTEAIYNNNVLIAEANSKHNVLMIILIVIGLLIVLAIVVVIIVLIAFYLRRKKREPEVKTPELQTELAPLTKKDDNNVLSDEQNDLNAKINDKECNDGSVNSMEGLGPHVAYRLAEVHQPRPTEERQQTSTKVHQPVDSETSDCENLGVHHERRRAHPEGASLLSETLPESDDKIRQSNSTPPPSSTVGLRDVVLHKLH